MPGSLTESGWGIYRKVDRRELPLMALLRLKPSRRFPSAFTSQVDSFGVYVCCQGHNGTNLGKMIMLIFDPKQSFAPIIPDGRNAENANEPRPLRVSAFGRQLKLDFPSFW